MQVLKRNVAVILLAGLVLGGAAVAWAGGSPARPTVLAAAQTGETTTPSSTPATPPTPLTPEERQAKRAALKECMEKAGEDTAARQACLAAAGLPRLGERGPGHGGPGRHGPRPGAMGVLGKAVHGQVVVPADGETWQTVTFDRGKVNEATDGSKIVLDRPDGESVTIALTADTKYHGIADAAAIQEGKPAVVISKDGKATQVAQHDPAHVRGPKPGHGPGPAPGNNGEAPVVPND